MWEQQRAQWSIQILQYPQVHTVHATPLDHAHLKPRGIDQRMRIPDRDHHSPSVQKNSFP